MKLYDWWKHDKGSYDCYDTELTISVTIDWIDGSLLNSDYGKFAVELTKKVDFVERVSDSTLICDWSKLIRDNYSKFKEFTAWNWQRDYADPEEFIFQWIRELHYYVAGYVPEETYSKILDLVDTLK